MIAVAFQVRLWLFICSNEILYSSFLLDWLVNLLMPIPQDGDISLEDGIFFLFFPFYLAPLSQRKVQMLSTCISIALSIPLALPNSSLLPCCSSFSLHRDTAATGPVIQLQLQQLHFINYAITVRKILSSTGLHQ